MLPSCMVDAGYPHRIVSPSPRDLFGLRAGVCPEPSRRALDCSFSFVFSSFQLSTSDFQPPLIPKSFACHTSETSRRSDLSPLECAVAGKHRVLPVFSRNRQHSSPLEATLMSVLVSVDSKWFTVRLSPLEATLTGNRGEGAHPSSQRFFLAVRHAPPVSPLQTTAFGATISDGTKQATRPGKHISQDRCLRIMSGHRGQLDLGPLCKSCLGPAF